MTPRWLWVFPLSQLLHIFEEMLGHYRFHRLWVARPPNPTELLIGRARAFEVPEFLLMQVLYVTVLLIGIFAINRWKALHSLAAVFSGVLLLNAGLHVGASIYQHAYLSGLVTAVMLWIPLAIVAIRWSWHRGKNSCVSGLLLSLFLQSIIILMGTLYGAGMGGLYSERPGVFQHGISLQDLR